MTAILTVAYAGGLMTTDGPGNGSEFKRGQEQGRVAAQLTEHGERLVRIEGLVERLAERSVRDLASLKTEVQKLCEQARLREERVEVARKTLAEDTERRREELAATKEREEAVVTADDRRFTRRERMMATVVAVLGFALAVVTMLLR